MRSRRLWTSLLGGLVVVSLGGAGAGVASGASVTAKFQDVAPMRVVNISIDGGGTYAQEIAGRFNWQRVDGVEDELPQREFVTFCIELTQVIHYGGRYTYEEIDLASGPSPGGWGVGAGMGQDKANLLGELWAAHYDETAGSRDKSAAFQLAVWETVYDDGLALDGGSFRVRDAGTSAAPACVGLAEDWLSSLTGHGARARLGALSSPTAQDQLYLCDSSIIPGPLPAPLPGAAWLGMGLLAGLGAMGAWRRHQNA